MVIVSFLYKTGLLADRAIEKVINYGKIGKQMQFCSF